MNSAATSLLSLAGCLSAYFSLASGEALRTEDGPAPRRFTPRMVLSLVCLCAAVLGSLAMAFQAPGGLSFFMCLPALLLAMGTGLILWAYLTGPRLRGNETLGERLTRRGQIALGVLVAGQLAELATGQAFAPLKQWLPSSTGVLAFLGVLGLLLVLLGTGTAAMLYRSSTLLLPREGSLLKRLRLPVKGAVLFLSLALVVLGLASLLAPEIEAFMTLLFLTLGIVTGIMALYLDRKAGSASEAAPWGVSPRGWVSLGLLGLTAVTLGVQDLRLLGFWGERKVTDAERERAQQRASLPPVLDQPSAWSMRLPTPDLADAAQAEKERQRKEKILADERTRIAELERQLAEGKKQPVPVIPAPPEGGKEQSPLEKTLLTLVANLLDLEAQVKDNPSLAKTIEQLKKNISDVRKEIKAGKQAGQ